MEWLFASLGVIPVATVVSVAVTFLVRWLDRSRAVFSFEMQLNRADRSRGSDDAVFASIAITNTGDGVAFDVEFFGHWTDVAVTLPALFGHPTRFSMRVPQIAPGETLILESVTPQERKVDAAVVMRWTLAPERPWPLGRRRKQRVPLGLVASAMPLPVGAFEPEPLPRLWRLRRDLSRWSPRARLQDPRNQPEEEPAPQE